MNKEQIIDEVYQNYLTNFIPPTCPPNLDVQPSYYEPMTKEWFIKSIKERGLRGEEFSDKWGLKIEERELSLEERFNIYKPGGKFSAFQENYPGTHKRNDPNDLLDAFNIPTKLITLTNNNETIESYE